MSAHNENYNENKEQNIQPDTTVGSYEMLEEIIDKTPAIDVHTHLFPPEFQDMFLFGIDELLTYHYLIAEYFSHPVPHTPEEFYSLSKQSQAEYVWEKLFVQNTPISEACKGVLTVLDILRLNKELQELDLNKIRKWFNSQENQNMYVDLIFVLSKVHCVYMTNNPFDPIETKYWKQGVQYNKNKFRSCIRVDELFYPDKLFTLKNHINDNFTIHYKKKVTILDDFANDSEEECDDNEGTIISVWDYWNNGSNIEYFYEYFKNYLDDWYTILNPDYVMMSLPYDFSLRNSYQNKIMINIIIPFAQKYSLPIFLKIGADRKVNPELKSAGDSVGISQLDWLGNLCREYNKIKFVATVLSVNNQHQLAVLSRKFSNLHIYGCWWFCNIPSIIKSITQMRLELLGTSFTYQHSDSRVLEHLLYKWAHSRQNLLHILNTKYSELLSLPYPLTRNHLINDVKNLLGEKYLEYIHK